MAIPAYAKQSEQHPIRDVSSSHMARRTFIGNLYKKVKDPNLVGKLSDHCEGSKAFIASGAIGNQHCNCTNIIWNNGPCKDNMQGK